MAISYDVPPGTILLCDYSKGGFLPPEMVKRRPVVAVSPRLRHRTGLLTVVPLSTTPPDRVCAHHCMVAMPLTLPGFPAREAWVKADMLATVAFERLDLFRTGRDQYGKRKYLHPRLSDDDLSRVRDCIRAALGI